MRINRSVIWLGILPAMIVPVAMAGLAERPGHNAPHHGVGLRVVTLQPHQHIARTPKPAGRAYVIRGKA
ncbi:hypothetical protein SAMN05216212_2608 [Microbulbifer yueqingensis]|uniref:Uncharacterized protein n=1 Tax=Microbulbifer yueqingensis TaxID=658219 RepID=A0A1G9CSC5_9GAMM|nr:hypothetical protein SAMN05216212_2608 [Microbulbifer yueqingensis]